MSSARGYSQPREYSGYSQPRDQSGKAFTPRRPHQRDPNVPQIVETAVFGEDEKDFHIIGQFEDPYLGTFKIIDRKRASTEYEKQMILSFDDSYKRALLVGQTFVIKHGQVKKEDKKVPHIKGPQWVFEELKKQAQRNRDRFVGEEQYEFDMAAQMAAT